jgi:hypothetical protein
MKEEDIDRAQSYYNTISATKKYGLLAIFLIIVLLVSFVAWNHCTTKGLIHFLTFLSHFIVNLPSLKLDGDVGQIRTVIISNFPQCYFGPYEKGYTLTKNDCSFQKIDYNISEDEITIRITKTKTEIKFCFQCNIYIFCVLVYIVPDLSNLNLNDMVRLELERFFQINGQFTMLQIDDGKERNISITIHHHTKEEPENDSFHNESHFEPQQRGPSPKGEIEKLNIVFVVFGFMIVFVLCFIVLLSIVGGIFLFFSGFCAGCFTGCCCFRLTK